jgi:uncharacterized protein
MRLRPLCLAAVMFASAAFCLSPNRPVNAAEKKAPAATFEVYQDKGGEYRWRLRAQNTQILAIAPDGYKEKRSCLAAIESVKRDVADAPVKEEAAPAAAAKP